jgi:protein-tyrosine phosphatase family protein
MLLAVLIELGHVLLAGNFHVVIPGQVYRCAQPSAQELDGIIARHDIRTVINLRGECNPADWYLGECRTSHRHNVCQEDLCFSAGRLPATQELHRLVEVLDHTEYPVLFHCHRGADRTGLASAVALLLKTDARLAEGRRQLGLRYSHLALGRPANLDRFFDLYSEWLDGQGLSHSSAVFRRWLLDEYCPGECRCNLELVNAPDHATPGEPFALLVRCANTSIKPWRFRPESNAGIHLFAVLTDLDGRYVTQGRAGYFDAVVNPGEQIVLTLAMPPVALAGKYRLQIDMVDAQHCYFNQTGQEPLEWELDVR